MRQVIERRDYYALLSVERNASQEEIKRAFRRLAMQHHPDRGGDEERFKEIGIAYNTLSDPKKRARYDSIRNTNSRSSYREQPAHRRTDRVVEVLCYHCAGERQCSCLLCGKHSSFFIFFRKTQEGRCLICFGLGMLRILEKEIPIYHDLCEANRLIRKL